MSQRELPYEESKQKIIKIIEERGLKILATSNGDFVTAREVRCFSDGLKMYFITDIRSRKYTHISANPNVAVAVGNLQIEGNARIKGRSSKEENSEFHQVFKEKLAGEYSLYEQSGHFENSNHVLIEVVPQRISVYLTKRHDNVPEGYVLLLDVKNEKAYKIEHKDYPNAPAYNK